MTLTTILRQDNIETDKTELPEIRDRGNASDRAIVESPDQKPFGVSGVESVSIMQSWVPALIRGKVPLCTEIDDCWKLALTVERTGKIFGLMEQLRFSGIARGWHEIVQNGVIGKPVFGEGEYFDHKKDFWFQDQDGVFYTPDQAKQNPNLPVGWRHAMDHIIYLPHELSPILYILRDRVVRVVAMGTNPEQSYRFDNVRSSDVQVALMHTAKDTVLRMAVSYSATAIQRSFLGSHWWHTKGTEGVLESPRSWHDKPKLYVEKWQTKSPMEMDWDTNQSRRKGEMPQPNETKTNS